MNRFAATVCASLAALSATSAWAQKSQDTLRLAISEPFPVVSPYHHSVDESVNFYRSVYERLIEFDEGKRDYTARLATSWKRVSPTAIEFDLRNDVTFHNGSKFDADDVVATIDWARDPKTKIRSKPKYAWVKSVEKLGPYKVRIESSEVNSQDIGLIAYFFPIFDAETMKAVDNMDDYGRVSPYGTGPYKVAEIDRNRGVTVERYDNYKGASWVKAPIRRIRGIPIPDPQTQIAQLLTDNIDMIRNVSPQSAGEIKKDSRFDVSAVPSADILMFGLDAAGKTGNKPLTDPRVRRAMWMAIDREALIKHIIPGGDMGAVEKLLGMCFPNRTISCSISVPPPAYDPAGAKKLLAEAGYADGFDMTYDVFAPVKDIGEAIAGELRKVGIRVAAQPMPISVYSARKTKGEQQAFTIFYPTQLFPDAGYVLGNYFGGDDDSSNDSVIHKTLAEGAVEFDIEKRAKIYERVLNRNNEMNYIMAVSSMPNVYANVKAVGVGRNPMSETGTNIADYYWK
jgi:peptide/nickel transport system substrate-binding protein